MSESSYLISTPENVDLHLELAGLGNRILACLVDTLLTYLMVGLLISVTMVLGVVIENSPLPKDIRIIAWLGAIGGGILIGFCILFGYFIYFEALWSGQTPGKKLLGIRVLEQNGQPISAGAAFIRNLVRVIDTGFALIGLVIIWIEPRERRLGDLAAGTIVIRERLQPGANLLASYPGPADSFLDVGQVSPAEYELALDFLSRRDQLESPARSNLGKRLAAYLQKKLKVTSATGESAEAFLENLVRSYQARA